MITGATSFIGRRIVNYAAQEGWSVIAVTRMNGKSRINNDNVCRVLELDMKDYFRLGKLAPNVDCFVHLAWDGTRGQDRFEKEKQENNCVCGMSAIKSVVDSGCKTIITAGSQAEYGLVTEEITENTPCNPNTAYGYYKLKLFEDALTLCRQSGVAVKDSRFFSLYGPGDYEKTAVMQCVRNMCLNEPCELTACTQMWNYLYVDDAARAVLSLCASDCQEGAYNIASGDSRTLRQYIEEMKRVLNSSSELRYGAVPYTKAGPVSICPSIRKIVEATGWRPVITFSEGVKLVARSLEVNGSLNE